MPLPITAEKFLEFLDKSNSSSNNYQQDEATYWLGYCHYYGTGGVVENDGEAVRIWLRAPNYPKIMARLAFCYRWGKGVQMYRQESQDLYVRATPLLQLKTQDAEALYLMGRFHRFGWGNLERNATKSVECWTRALEINENHVDTLWSLAECYRDGKGVAEADPVRAVEFFSRVAELQDDLIAQHEAHYILNGLEYHERARVEACVQRNRWIRQLQELTLEAPPPLGVWTKVLSKFVANTSNSRQSDDKENMSPSSLRGLSYLSPTYLLLMNIMPQLLEQR